MRLKTFILTIGLGVVMAFPAFGDDQPLTADSSADQVSAALDHWANVAMDKQSNRGFSSSPQYWVYSEDTVALGNKLSGASFKVLLDVLNQTKQYDKSTEMDSKLILKREALYKAMKNSATDTDLTDLLSSPAVEALWIVSAHPSWQRDAAVTTFLTAQLGNLPSDSDDQTPYWLADSYIYNVRQEPSPSQTWEWTVLNLASLDDNPAVQKLLVETIRNGLDKSGTPTLFFCNALSVVAGSKNPDVTALATDLMTRLVTIGKFPYSRVYRAVSDLLNAHPDLVKDAAFDSAALGFVKDSPFQYSYGIHDDQITLARLGDSLSFCDTVAIYFDKDAFSDMGSSAQSYKQEFNQSFEPMILSKIVYRGSDDRVEGIKTHFRSAVFKDGQWIIAGPDETASAPISSLSSPAAPPPAPVAPSPKPSVAAAQTPPPSAPTVQPVTSAAPAPALPDHVSITTRAPIETLDGTGQVTAASMAKVGTTYKVVRADGKFLIVQDATGTQYRISGQATAPPSN